MDLGIAGRPALVCASTGGLGLAVARALAAERARVVISGRRGDLAKSLAGELPGAVGVEADLTAPDGPDRLHAATVEALGEPHIVVLNGPGPAPGKSATMSGEAAETALRTLFLPHRRLVELTLPAMRRAGWGRLLALASSGVAEPLPELAASNVGRWALAAYLKTLATDVAADGVTVNLLLPGRIATDRVAALDNARAEQEHRSAEEVEADVRATIPAHRYGKPEEFGAVGAFLCGEPASYITGSAVRCDGGLVRAL